MNTTTAKKLTKGFYQLDFAGHSFYIVHTPEVEGTNKWHVSCATVNVDEHMDTLWNTLTEAAFMIGYSFTIDNL